MTDSTYERWRPVVGHEGAYEISDLGRVRSVDHVVQRGNGWPMRIRGRVLRPSQATETERAHVVLGMRDTRKIHKLVLESFVGPCPDGMEGCHNNGDHSDNRLANLRWDTRSNNALDKQRHGTDVRRNRTMCPRGHLLQEPNLVAASARKGQRECLACSRARSQVFQGYRSNHRTAADDEYALILAGKKPGVRAPRTACLRGHPLTPENTITKKSGKRQCRTCELEAKRRAYAAKKAQQDQKISGQAS